MKDHSANILQKQEQVLFKLLFNDEDRAHFCADATAWMKTQQLDEDSINDFLYVNTHALQLEARFRKTMMLEQLCKKIPLSFCVWAAIYGGREGFNHLLNAQLVSLSGYQRVAACAHLMFEIIRVDSSVHGRIREWGMAIIYMEWKRMESACRIDSSDGYAEVVHVSIDNRTLLTMPSICSRAIIPCDESTLRHELLPAEISKVWLQLKNQLPNHQRFDKYSTQPSLCLSKPFVVFDSKTDKVIEFKTVCLPAFFAALLPQSGLNTKFIDIEKRLASAGCKLEEIFKFKNTLEMLVKYGMLVCS